MNSPVQEYAPPNGATSQYATGLPQDVAQAGAGGRAGSPVMEDPGADLERELAAGPRKY